MKHLQLLAWICLLLLPCAALAQSPRAQGDNFMATLSKGQVADAYARLFDGSNIGRDQAQSMVQRTETTLRPLGKLIGYDLIREEQINGSLSRLVYLLKSERHATVWELYYYRPASRWFVAEVNFSQKFDAVGSKK
jgi:hypothetical protein